ncbi:MAG: ATP-dependent Clp protease adaptor ClpS [Bacteroidia bacterium]|nr:ATP-dependent Clp protease adaptor ClpS [Bacteroidia bacterium]MCZ2247925.1 ATP-dependent Clp protease adaptor ClpS [Bacteroidia bacterium]
MKANTRTETLTLEDILEDVEQEKSLILYNDDVNTFDYVIDSLIEVCNHDIIQAEQCTYLVHYAGKCDVKNGTFEELKPMRTELSRRGLTAKIL